MPLSEAKAHANFLRFLEIVDFGQKKAGNTP